MEEIAREVIRQIGIPQDRLYSLTRDRQGTLGRKLVAYLAGKLTGPRIKEISHFFKRTPMIISLGVTKIESLLLRHKGLAGSADSMEMNLREKGKKKYLITIA